MGNLAPRLRRDGGGGGEEEEGGTESISKALSLTKLTYCFPNLDLGWSWRGAGRGWQAEELYNFTEGEGEKMEEEKEA